MNLSKGKTLPSLWQMVESGQLAICSNLAEQDIRQALRQRPTCPLSDNT